MLAKYPRKQNNHTVTKQSSNAATPNTILHDFDSKVKNPISCLGSTDVSVDTTGGGGSKKFSVMTLEFTLASAGQSVNVVDEGFLCCCRDDMGHHDVIRATLFLTQNESGLIHA